VRCVRVIALPFHLDSSRSQSRFGPSQSARPEPSLLAAALLVWLAARRVARSEAEARLDDVEDGFTSATQRFSLSE